MSYLTFFLIIILAISYVKKEELRGRAEVARETHNLKVGSSSLPPATKLEWEK